MKLRKETDSMGTINVDEDKYWGASTERSKKYFDIGKILVSKNLINAIAIIKLAAAKIHKKDKQIDILFNNAGVFGSSVSLENSDPKEWKKVIDINLTSTFLITKSVLKKMLKSRTTLIYLTKLIIIH